MTSNSDYNELMYKIAIYLGGKIVEWDTINETIENNIEFTRYINPSNYLSLIEQKKIEEKLKY